MAEPRRLVEARNDGNFRKGACHAGDWFLQTARSLADQGHSAADIADHLKDLAGVLSDWRGEYRALPDGNPWDWSFKDLSSVVRARKGE